MKTVIPKSKLRKYFLLFLLVSINLPAFPQLNIGRQTILQFDPGHQAFKPDAPPLTESLPMSEGSGNAAFLGGVGGVSFDQVAIPAAGLQIQSLTLNYRGQKSEGNHLELLINGRPVKVELPDWLLIPIAKYAGSPYYSCVTLFGKLKDKNLEKAVAEHEGRVINYHPCLESTLLGIRLVYMDMLVGYPSFTTDLPKNDKGEYLLGKGELPPEINVNNEGFAALSQHLIQVKNMYDQQFRSYVISDYSRKISFSIPDDSLVIDNYPFFYCWKFNGDRTDYDIQKVADKISEKYNAELKNISASTGYKAAQEWVSDKLNSLVKKYDGHYHFYDGGTFVDLVNTRDDSVRRDMLMKYAPESLFDIIVKTETYMDRDSVVYLRELSEAISSKPELFSGANPAVWHATITTMRFAALFRYIRTNFPETWKSFSAQIANIDPVPRIFTPTIMYDPDSKSIETALAKYKGRHKE